jgi:hypothetical protein
LFADTVDMDPLREVDVDQEKMRKKYLLQDREIFVSI